MAVKIRLQRGGKKKQPFYRIVAADGRYKRDGRFLERLGSYNPNTDPMTIDVKESRVMYWLGVGAQPTDTVRNLLSRKGIMLKWHMKRKGKADEEIAAEFQKWEAMQALKREKELERKTRRKGTKKKKAAAPAADAAPAAASETPAETPAQA